MKDKYILGICILIIYFSNAMEMEKENQAYSNTPVEIFEMSIIPYIIALEKKSVKQARCDLYHLSRVNKKTHKFISLILEKEPFTNFFIDSLATINLLEGNKLAIAAHLGTQQSMQWIKKYLACKHLGVAENKLSYMANREITKSLILLDGIETDYMINAHKLLFHLVNIGLYQSLEWMHVDDPSVTLYYDTNPQKHSLIKLKNDNKITKRIFSLLDGNFINLEPNDNWETPLMHSLRCHRTDLVPLFFTEKSINDQNKFGHTVLMYAVKAALDDSGNKYESLEAFNFLMNKNPNVESRDINNLRAFDHAYFHENKFTQQGRSVIQKLMDAQEVQYRKSLQNEKTEE